jgi:sulfur-oxidizing protein SoxA
MLLTGLAMAGERPAVPRPGISFQSPDTQQQQRDEGANPGLLWVERGAELWGTPPVADARACESCHGPAGSSMKGVAARHPAIDAGSGRLLNLEGRINECRTTRQGAPALPYETRDLVALTAYVTYQSRGMARQVAIDGPARPYFEAGRAFYTTRQGQLDLACTQCHDDNVGRRLRGDVISQGQSDGWPAYRLEWQAMGSLHRRLRACSLGVRAEILDYGSPEYLALELYLAWRGEGLAIDAPGVRK